MLRSERQAKILELITEKEIDTQEELCNELNKINFTVTQATISRDIKELCLFKVAGTNKKYRYAYVESGDNSVTTKMKSLFRDSVISMKNAENLIVIKTLSGNGNNAGSVIDKLNYEEILGCVAGDDTVFVACHTAQDAIDVIEKLKSFMQ